LIATTRVKDGRLRLFRDDEVTLEAVLASTCLPHLHHAVEIEGEWYWDGGYSANPPLRQLVIGAKADDILLVQVTPETPRTLPRLSRDIARRISQIAFNNPLQKEVEALADLRELCKKGRNFRSRLCRKLQRLRLHRIAAEDGVESSARRARSISTGPPYTAQGARLSSCRAMASRYFRDTSRYAAASPMHYADRPNPAPPVGSLRPTAFFTDLDGLTRRVLRCFRRPAAQASGASATPIPRASSRSRADERRAEQDPAGLATQADMDDALAIGEKAGECGASLRAASLSIER